MISSEKIQNIIHNCLYKKEEVIDNQIPKTAIISEGIRRTFCFHPGRIKENEKKIIDLIEELPPDRKSVV